MKVKHPLSGVIWEVADPNPYLSVGWTEVIEAQPTPQESEQAPTAAEAPVDTDAAPETRTADEATQPTEDPEDQDLTDAHIKTRRHP